MTDSLADLFGDVPTPQPAEAVPSAEPATDLASVFGRPAASDPAPVSEVRSSTADVAISEPAVAEVPADSRVETVAEPEVATVAAPAALAAVFNIAELPATDLPKGSGVAPVKAVDTSKVAGKARPAKKRRPESRERRRYTPSKEAMFVRVDGPDGTTVFVDVTSKIGESNPYANLRGTCAMVVNEKTVAFSYLHVGNALRKKWKADDRPLELPRAPIARLVRRAHQFCENLPGDVLVVEHKPASAGKDAPASEYRFRLDRDENQVANLTMLPSAHNPEADEVAVELSMAAEKFDMYLVSPQRGLRLALTFFGSMGRAGTKETLTRMVAKALNAVLGLTEFRALAGLSIVDVPPAPRVANLKSATQVNVGKAEVLLPVSLYTEEADGSAQPLVDGEVLVSVDLKHTSTDAQRLLFNYTPSDALAPHWAAYRDTCDAHILGQVRHQLGDLMSSICYDIILGQVEAATVEALKGILVNLPGVILTPTRVAIRS